MPYNKIREIANIENNVNLEHLTLLDNNISCIQGLEHASKLITIDLSKNLITSSKGLEDCAILEELYLNHNHVRRLEGLDRLERLRLLEISHNRLESLEGIPPNLRTLNAYHNKISDLAPLKGNLNFFNLDLSCNRISRVEPGTITSIQLLDLSRNLLEDMDFVAGLDYCNGLNLSHNRITRLVLPALSREEICMGLQYREYPFYVAGNPLPASDLERLSRYLDGLPPAPDKDFLQGFPWEDRKDA